MPSARVFIQTSLLVSLCAAFPAQGEAQNETAKNASKKRIAALGIPVPPAQSVAPRPTVQTPAKDIAAAARKAVSKSYPSNSFERGLYLKQQGQLKPALLEFIKSAHEDPRQVRAFYEQAQIFKQLGNPKLAKSALEQALAIQPSYTDARTMLVQTHLESGNLMGVASEVGKLFNIGQERPKREAPSFLDYQSAPSAAVQIAKGKYTKSSSSSSLNISPAPSETHTAQPAPTEEKQASSESAATDETSAWLSSAIKGSTQNSAPSSAQVSTESDTTPKTVSAPDTAKSTTDILASLGVQTSTSPTATTAAAGGTQSASASASSGSSDAQGAGIIGRMRARTGQAINSVQRISKSNMETVKRISHVPHVAVPPVPQWMKDVRSHIPFMPEQGEQKEASATETPKEGLKEQAASLMTWMKDRLPIQTKEKENRQLAEKMKAAMGSATNGPQLSPEVAKAIEAKLGITKAPDPLNTSKTKTDEKASIYSPEVAKAIEAKLAQARGESSKPSDSPAAKTDTLNPSAEKPSKQPDTSLPESKSKGDESKIQLVELVPQEAGSSSFSLSDQAEKEDGDGTKLQDISAVFADSVFEYNQKALGGDGGNSPQGNQAGSTSEMDNVKQVLASLGIKSDAESEAANNITELTNRPAYGLLGNTALKTISRLPRTQTGPKASIFDSIWKQAGSTFAHLIPKIDWKLPTIDTSALLNNKQELSPQMIAATTDPAAEIKSASGESSKQLNELANSSTAPSPVPLDVSRILSKLGPAPTRAASPIAPPLSATMPIAAPVNADQYIPMPAPQTVATLPQPQGLNRTNSNTAIGPKTSPSANNVELPGVLPPVVQQVWDQAQPLLQPAMKAATSLAQSFAPTPIPIGPQDGTITTPVDMKSQSPLANGSPTPIGADMTQNFGNQAVPTMPSQAGDLMDGLTKTGGRELISSAREKNGAFTFVKPVIDSDSTYLLGAKQVRTIQQPVVKPVPKPAPPPEDAITKRMRYLMENGTSNLRPGEAFMFSEETGEGILFLPGRTERRKLTAGRDAEQVLRERRPDIAQPKDLQYSLQLLGKLMPTQNGNQMQQQVQQQPAINQNSLDQLMNQMDQGQKSVWGWMKNTFKI